MRVPCWLSGWFTLEKRRMKRIKKTWGAPFQLCYSYHYFSLEKGSTSLASSHSELVWVEEGSFACFGIDIGISILSLVNLKKVLGENQILCFSTSCICVCVFVCTCFLSNIISPLSGIGNPILIYNVMHVNQLVWDSTNGCDMYLRWMNEWTRHGSLYEVLKRSTNMNIMFLW